MSEEDFNSEMERRKRITEAEIRSNNSELDPELKQKRIRDLLRIQKAINYGDTFTMYDENSHKFIFNEMAYVCEQYLYDLQRHNYLNGVIIREQIDDRTFNADEEPEQMIYEEQLNVSVKKGSFVDWMK